MDAKLTLKLNQEIIEKAKLYASDKKLSLSRLIENYLNALTSEKTNNELEISDFVKSMSSKTGIPADYDYKNERATDLEKKHK
jgi:glutamate synthase domain-containing protein 3